MKKTTKNSENKKAIIKTIDPKEHKTIDNKEIDNGNGTASLVLGILSLCFVGTPISIILGVIGIVLSNKQDKIISTKNSKAGKITSIIGLSISGFVLFIIILIILLFVLLLI